MMGREQKWHEVSQGHGTGSAAYPKYVITQNLHHEQDVTQGRF